MVASSIAFILGVFFGVLLVILFAPMPHLSKSHNSPSIHLPNKEETMKLYHVETQEDYDALMVKLEEEGCLWNYSGFKPTAYNMWTSALEDTVIEKNDKTLNHHNLNYYLFDSLTETNLPIQKYKAKQDKVAKWFDDATNAMKALSAGGVSVKNENTDNVNNPSHYTSGGIETLDYIKAKVKDYPSYAAGNILKYVSRYEYKNGIEDLKKAQFYLNDLIEWMESK